MSSPALWPADELHRASPSGEALPYGLASFLRPMLSREASGRIGRDMVRQSLILFLLTVAIRATGYSTAMQNP